MKNIMEVIVTSIREFFMRDIKNATKIEYNDSEHDVRIYNNEGSWHYDTRYAVITVIFN